MLLFQKQMIARSLFEREGFYLLPTVYEQRIVFILLDQMPAKRSPRTNSPNDTKTSKIKTVKKPTYSRPLLGIGKTRQ